MLEMPAAGTARIDGVERVVLARRLRAAPFVRSSIGSRRADFPDAFAFERSLVRPEPSGGRPGLGGREHLRSARPGWGDAFALRLRAAFVERRRSRGPMERAGTFVAAALREREVALRGPSHRIGPIR
jgi:hypothetical protein